MSKFGLTALACLAIGALTACGSNTQNVELAYVPSETATVSVAGSGTIYLKDFEDSRFEKEDIGDIRNGYGARLGDVVLRNDAAETITAAVQKELERAGYTVERIGDGSAPGGTAELGGKVTLIECCSAAFSTFESELNIEATLARGGERLMDQAFIGKGDQQAFFGGTEAFNAAMSKALGDAVTKLVDQVGSVSL